MSVVLKSNMLLSKTHLHILLKRKSQEIRFFYVFDGNQPQEE